MPDTHATAEAARLDELVERWFFDSFHGSAVARSTETWNTVHAAKEELKHRLAAYRAGDFATAAGEPPTGDAKAGDSEDH